MSINFKSISTSVDNLHRNPSKQDLMEQIGEFATVKGHVINFRETSWGGFALIQTSNDIIQVVVGNTDHSDNFKKGNWVEVSGEVKEKRSKNKEKDVEISCSSVQLMTSPEIESPIDLGMPFIEANQSLVLDEAIVSLRHRLRRAIFQVQAEITHNFRNFLKSQGFTEIFSPKIVGGNAEGGANVFGIDYYGEDAFLAQSPQFYKQYTANSFGRVFEVGPVFRAEPSRTSRHLATYTSMDYEMSGINSFEDVMAMEAVLLANLINEVRSNCSEAMNIISEAKKAQGEEDGEIEMPDMSIDIPQIRFHDAKDLISDKYGKISGNPDDLEPEDERLIAKLVKEETGSDFVFITHYPIVKRPFYTMPDNENPSLTHSFDLLFRGLEITTGGQRIHSYEQQVDMMGKKGLDPNDFSDFLKLHQYGAAPHGGLAIGLERLTMQILGLDNIREATLFPRDTQRLNP